MMLTHGVARKKAFFRLLSFFGLTFFLATHSIGEHGTFMSTEYLFSYTLLCMWWKNERKLFRIAWDVERYRSQCMWDIGYESSPLAVLSFFLLHCVCSDVEASFSLQARLASRWEKKSHVSHTSRISMCLLFYTHTHTERVKKDKKLLLGAIAKRRNVIIQQKKKRKACHSLNVACKRCSNWETLCKAQILAQCLDVRQL